MNGNAGCVRRTDGSGTNISSSQFPHMLQQQIHLNPYKFRYYFNVRCVGKHIHRLNYFNFIT